MDLLICIVFIILIALTILVFYLSTKPRNNFDIMKSSNKVLKRTYKSNNTQKNQEPEETYWDAIWDEIK